MWVPGRWSSIEFQKSPDRSIRGSFCLGMNTEIVQQLDKSIAKLKELREKFAMAGEAAAPFHFCCISPAGLESLLQFFRNGDRTPNREESAAFAKAIGENWTADGLGKWEGVLAGMPEFKLVIHNAEAPVRSVNPVEL